MMYVSFSLSQRMTKVSPVLAGTLIILPQTVGEYLCLQIIHRVGELV